MKQSTHRTIKFSILVRIEHFPSFVISKAKYKSFSINFNNTEWFIMIRLYKCGQTSNDDICVTSSSTEQPETLGAFLCGKRSDRKECSFDVNAIFKFKRPSTAMELRFSHKFNFNSTEHYYDSWGSRKSARINVILLYHFLSIFCLTVNFRIFWTSAMVIWLIIHSNCSSTFQFLNANRFSFIDEWIFDLSMYNLTDLKMYFRFYP